MQFPPAQRVIFENNPLREVIFQVRYPTLLQIEERIPADFQMALEGMYPLAAIKQALPKDFQITLGTSLPKPLTCYEFSSIDRTYRISLTCEYVMIATSEYERWEVFLTHVVRVLKALEQSYSVPFYTRVGLRYVNVIDKAKLKLQRVPWNRLLRKSVLGIMNEKDLAGIGNWQTTCQIALDCGILQSMYGTGADEAGAPVFVIDNDFFVEAGIEGVEATLGLLTRFNSLSGRAFNWFITDRLRTALSPNAFQT